MPNTLQPSPSFTKVKTRAMSEFAADRPESTTWIRIPSEEEARRDLPQDYGYDHALLPSFFRLLHAHEEISEVF